jgi:hypothetical protein
MATISTLQPQVAHRLEEDPAATIFWNTELEIYSALQEAQADLLLLVGRPNQTVSVPFTIQPNTPFQQIPKGMFCLLNLQGPASEVWKVTLEDLDYSQVSDSGWQQDIGETVQKWAPLGFNQFIVWPSVAIAQTVLATGIASPITGIWPYLGDEPLIFHNEQEVTLEKYAAAYCRLKEGGSEFSEGAKLYQDYLSDAKRLSQLEDRKDDYIFNGATGSRLTSNPTTIR